MSEEKITEGVKIEESEAATLDPTKMGIAMAGDPPETEVEGQVRYLGYTRCPWCGNVGRSILDTNRYLWFRCGRCGGAFKA